MRASWVEDQGRESCTDDKASEICKDPTIFGWVLINMGTGNYLRFLGKEPPKKGLEVTVLATQSVIVSLASSQSGKTSWFIRHHRVLRRVLPHRKGKLVLTERLLWSCLIKLKSRLWKQPKIWTPGDPERENGRREGRKDIWRNCSWKFSKTDSRSSASPKHK